MRECYRASDIDDLEERVKQLERVDPPVPTLLVVGYTMGMGLATVLSWARNASILWCLLHGLLSWAYVIYFAFTS